MKAFWHTLGLRLAGLFRRRRFEAEMAEEMRQHLDELTRANVAAGMGPEEARMAAQRRFGSRAQIEERCRDERGFVRVDQLLNDIRFTAHSLSRARGFTITVLLTLFLGIGVTTAVFDQTAAVVIYRSPFPQAGRLLAIGCRDKQGVSYTVRGVEFQAYREQTRVFSQFAAVHTVSSNVVVEGRPVGAWVQNASIDCFGALGVRPALGRGFVPDEHREGANNVVVISDLFWRQHFNSDPDVLGRKIRIDMQVCSVVGVLPEGLVLPPNFHGEVFQPLVDKADPADDPLYTGLYIIGRLKDGVTREQALAALSAVKLPAMAQWAADFLAQHRPVLTPLNELDRPDMYRAMLLAAAFLYAIACLNVMNLALIRTYGRRRELSIRLALGGSRAQLVQLLAIESIGLTLAASLAVALAARWVFPPLFARINHDDAALYADYWNWGTLSCVACLSAFAGLVAVLVPAWHLMVADVSSGLKDGGPMLGESRGAGRIRSTLVSLQAAFAVILLIGAGLMMRSFERLRHLDLGFEPAGLVKVQISLPRGYELKPEERLQLFERLQARVGAIPGVRGVTYGQDALFQEYYVAGAQLQMADGTYVPAAASYVSHDFQKTAGLVVTRGRWLSGKRYDGEAVINETFARARFGDRDPVGLSFKIKIAGDTQIPVVGVVRDVRETVRSPAGIRFYVPDWVYLPNIDSLILRLDGDPKKEFCSMVRTVIYGFDPRLTVWNVYPIDDLVSDSMWAERYAFTILKGLSAIALGLAVVGVFSVIAYTVDRRMTEFGIRLALGATSSDLKRLVLLRGLGANAVGLVIGTAGAVGLTRFMESLLFETKPYDPVVYLGVSLVLMIAGVAACWLPARRAAQVDVARLLRAD